MSDVSPSTPTPQNGGALTEPVAPPSPPVSQPPAPTPEPVKAQEPAKPAEPTKAPEAAKPTDAPKPADAAPENLSWEQVAERYPDAAPHIKRLQGDMSRAHERSLQAARAATKPPETNSLAALNDTVKRLAGMADGDPFEGIELPPKPDFIKMIDEAGDPLTDKEALAKLLDKVYEAGDARATSRITGLSKATYEPLRKQAEQAALEQRANAVEQTVRQLPGMRSDAEFDKVIDAMARFNLRGEEGFRLAHETLLQYNPSWTAPVTPVASAAPTPPAAPPMPEVVVRPPQKIAEADPMEAARRLSQSLNPSTTPARPGGIPHGSEGTFVEARALAKDPAVQAALKSTDRTVPTWMRVNQAVKMVRGG